MHIHILSKEHQSKQLEFHLNMILKRYTFNIREEHTLNLKNTLELLTFKEAWSSSGKLSAIPSIRQLKSILILLKNHKLPSWVELKKKH